jgi:signal transduction histidine kinase
MLSLLKETELSDQHISYVNTIENSSNAMMKLIDDVLEFSQSESKEIKAFLAPVNIRETVSEIQGLLQPIAMQKNLKFEIFFSQNVPKLIETDPVRFRQILLHLTSNAFKFTKVGHVRINVNTAPLDRERFELIVQVIDTGIGISKAIQETLFSDFFSTNALNEGGIKEGLGLGIARNLVMLLKGKIDCESKLGQGSIFWFSIPIKNPEVSKKMAEEKAEQPSAPQKI